VSRRRLGFFASCLFVTLATVAACGDTIIVYNGADGGDSDSALPGPGDAAADDGPPTLDGTTPPPVVVCEAGSETRITGVVYDPAGRNPLYNVRVYVPSGPVAPLPVGLPDLDVTGFCKPKTCDTETVNAKVAAVTNAKGEFVLQGPALTPGRNVPVVIQIGKWRRQIVVPEVRPCERTALDKASTRLPKNGSEGDMPQIVVTTGGCDALECLLASFGVDPAEVEAGQATDTKHVHVFRGTGGAATLGGVEVPSATSVWSFAQNMKRYDMALLSCECSEATDTKPNVAAIRDYTNLGGRVLASHFHYTWIKNNPAWSTQILDFSAPGPATSPYPVDTSSPKGSAFADWLVEVGASSTRGEVPLTGVTSSQRGLVSGASAKVWIGAGTGAKHVSFNTPYGLPPAQQCGKLAFSDVHVAGAGGVDFPSGCSAPNPSYVAMEQLFFELSSCVQDDSAAPPLPR